MMTYYEELGVPDGASREEIRQAYKRLVRLVHPDQCSNPATRVLAELQMRRINGILEVLDDPGERAKYDRWLRDGDAGWQRHRGVSGDGPRDHSRPPWHNWWRNGQWWWLTAARDAPCTEPPDREGEKDATQKGAWQAGYPLGRLPHHGKDRAMSGSAAAAGVLGLLGLLVFCALLPSSPPVRKPDAQAAVQERQPSLPRGRPTVRTRSSRAPATEEHIPPTDTLARDSPPARDPLAEAHPPENPEPTAIRTAAATVADAVPGGGPNTLTGEWFFVPAAEARQSGYPPEYIELRLREDQGVIRGRYRARYRVTDRAISPTVAFQFEGRTASEGGVLPWQGPGGAQGEITLRLLANGNLEVEWAAGQLGEELGLISGTATLVRKLE